MMFHQILYLPSVQEAPFSNKSYPLALTYINWETDAIVGIELIRNVGIALGGKKTDFLMCFRF